MTRTNPIGSRVDKLEFHSANNSNYILPMCLYISVIWLSVFQCGDKMIGIFRLISISVSIHKSTKIFDRFDDSAADQLIGRFITTVELSLVMRKRFFAYAKTKT